MSLLINGTRPEVVKVNGVDAQTVTANGTVVWEAYSGPPSPVIITASGDYTAGIDFPANKELNIQVLGAGGEGGWGDAFHYGSGGGAATLSSGNKTYSYNTVVSAVVGPSDSSDSNFDGIASTGGSAGSSPTGSNVPGEPGANSVWGSGGAGGSWGNNGSLGGIGAGGGGGGSATYNTSGGNGGRGEIRISWS